MVQLQPFYLSIFSCQITNRLLASMKVDPDIYCHRRLLLLTQIVSTVSLTTYGWRRLLHTIRPDPSFGFWHVMSGAAHLIQVNSAPCRLHFGAVIQRRIPVASSLRSEIENVVDRGYKIEPAFF